MSTQGRKEIPRIRRFVVVGLVGAALALPGLAQTVPTVMNYQGRLTDNTPQQNPVHGAVAMEFRIYGSRTGSDLLWSESWSAVDVVDGCSA